MTYVTLQTGMILVVIGSITMFTGYIFERYHSMRFQRLRDNLEQAGHEEATNIVRDFHEDERLDWVSRLMIPFQTIGTFLLFLGVTTILLASA